MHPQFLMGGRAVGTKVGLIILGVFVISSYLWFARPWEPSRYDDTPQGQQAKKIDRIVDRAIAYPNTQEARDMLSREPKFDGFQVYAEYGPVIEQLYTAGAVNVSFAYTVHTVRGGYQAEGLYAVLPKDPAKRKALIAIAQAWPHPPKECRQKYIYMRIRGWDVDARDPSFLGTAN
jgi:hypothetical protein